MKSLVLALSIIGVLLLLAALALIWRTHRTVMRLYSQSEKTEGQSLLQTLTALDPRLGKRLCAVIALILAGTGCQMAAVILRVFA